MEKIRLLMEAMGDNREAIAATLRDAGVQGLRDSSSFMNPLVRFLNRKLVIGGKLEVGVGGSTLRMWYEGKVHEVPLPNALREFLRAFHDGGHPELEVRPEEPVI